MTASGDRIMGEASLGEGVHASVVETLVRRIMEGGYPPLSTIPNADALASDLRASRTAVREALRVLEAKGFVDAKRRAGTRVLPRTEWSLLDREVLRWLFRDAGVLAFGQSLLVFRRVIEPETAALAAANASAADLALIEAAYLRMRDSLPDDVEAACQADVDFHVGLLKATGNIFLQQLAHTIREGLFASFKLTTWLAQSHVDALELHGRLVEHVRARDAQAARRCMEGILDVAAQRLGTQRLEPMDPSGPPSRRK